MLAYGIFVRGFIVLTKRTHHLRTAILACLVMAWPLFGGTQKRAATEPAQPRAKPHATADSLSAARSSEQALELAEIMLAMGLGQGAAQTLTEQIHDEPKGALRNWLSLLEIYRQTGQHEEFERSAEELRQHFNVQPEDWQAQAEVQRSIEDYPHIAARLTELWGKPYCSNYLGTLLNDNRDGARTGSPQSVAEELLLLAAVLKDGNPG